MSKGEIRITDKKSGGQKGMKAAAYDLIPPDSLEEVAKIFGWGTCKYADRNWERGYKWGLSYAAMMRHMMAFWRREDFDDESGLRHMAHAVWHGLVLLTFSMRQIGTDSRGVACKPDPVPDRVLRDLEAAIARACQDNSKVVDPIKPYRVPKAAGKMLSAAWGQWLKKVEKSRKGIIQERRNHGN
jgi:hypothetical protein